MVKFLMPQPPDVHVSDVLTHTTELVAKDGTHFNGTSNFQFFYHDGKISFGVVSVVATSPLLGPSTVIERRPTPAPIQPLPPESPSMYFSTSYGEPDGYRTDKLSVV